MAALRNTIQEKGSIRAKSTTILDEQHEQKGEKNSPKEDIRGRGKKRQDDILEILDATTHLRRLVSKLVATQMARHMNLLVA